MKKKILLACRLQVHSLSCQVYFFKFTHIEKQWRALSPRVLCNMIRFLMVLGGTISMAFSGLPGTTVARGYGLASPAPTSRTIYYFLPKIIPTHQVAFSGWRLWTSRTFPHSSFSVLQFSLLHMQIVYQYPTYDLLVQPGFFHSGSLSVLRDIPRKNYIMSKETLLHRATKHIPTRTYFKEVKNYFSEIYWVLRHKAMMPAMTY